VGSYEHVTRLGEIDGPDQRDTRKAGGEGRTKGKAEVREVSGEAHLAQPRGGDFGIERCSGVNRTSQKGNGKESKKTGWRVAGKRQRVVA